MITDILNEITEEDISLLRDLKKYVLNPRSCRGSQGLKIANAITKMLIVYDDYKALRLQREKIKGYVINELMEINKHQYAKGSRRLKKILHMIDEFDDNYYRGY